MITLSAKLVVALIAFVAFVLTPWVSRWIRRRGEGLAAEVGSGDEPGTRDRGPDGMRM